VRSLEAKLVAMLAAYGPGMLFAAQMFGIFGVPIPDELLLTIAGALVREGKLNAFWTALAAVSGCLCGVTLSYTLGRTVGITALRRIVRVPDSAFDRAQRWFQRIGRWLLTFGYFIPGVRHCTAIAAGSVPLPYREFALFCYSGGVMWCAVFLSFGYITGPHWRRAWQTLHDMGPYVFVPLLVIVAAAIYVSWRKTRTAAPADPTSAP
jgi:membrane protein DedA with SNARE-associated domain